MRILFSNEYARIFLLISLFLILAVLAATPIRSTIFIALLTIYSLFYLYFNKELKEGLGVWSWLVIIILSSYFFGRFIPFVNSGFTGRYISAGLHVASSIPIFLMARNLINKECLGKLHFFIAVGLAVSGLGSAFLAVYQTKILGWYAADGFLFSINFGFLNFILFALCLALIPSKLYRMLIILGGLGALVAVVLSGSRGAIFPIPLLIIVWLSLNIKRVYFKCIALILIGLPLIAFIVYSSMPIIKERTDIGLSEISSFLQGDLKREGSFSYRVQLWIAASEAFKESPWFGLTYPEREKLNSLLVSENKVVPWVEVVSRGHAHSQYFETLATGGIVGIIALLGYMILPLLLYFKIYLADKNNLYAMAGVLFTFAYALCGLTEVILQQEMIAAFYGFMQVVLLLMSKNMQVIDE